MKSLTIHKLEAELAKAIEELAKSTGLSQNKVIKQLLRKALGIDHPREPRRDFSEFCGLWTKSEAEEFEAAVIGFEQIDENMWR